MKRKVVKGWMLVSEGNLVIQRRMSNSQVYIFLDEKIAKEECCLGIIALPCELSYELPRKARKKV